MRVEKQNKAFAYRVPIGDYNYLQCSYTSSAWKTTQENSIMRPCTINLSMYNTYNVMCIDRAKVKIIYSGRFKENWYTDNTVKIVMIRKYIHLGIMLWFMKYLRCFFRIYINVREILSWIFALCWFLYTHVGKPQAREIHTCDICVLQRFGAYSVNSRSSWMRNLL